MLLPLILAVTWFQALPTISPQPGRSLPLLQRDGPTWAYRDEKGFHQVTLWLPPKQPRVLLIIGHGGKDGDSRDAVEQPAYRALAAQEGLVLVGLHQFEGPKVYEQGAGELFKALRTIGTAAGVAHLADLPFFALGHSNGGMTAYGLANAAPQRCIGFAVNVGGWYQPERPVAAAMNVPGLFVVGPHDPFFEGGGVPETRGLVTYARQHGAPWAWLAEPFKGHEPGYSESLWSNMLRASLKRIQPDGRIAAAPKGWLLSNEEPGKPIAFSHKIPGRETMGLLQSPFTATLIRAARQPEPVPLTLYNEVGPLPAGALHASGSPLFWSAAFPAGGRRIALWSDNRVVSELAADNQGPFPMPKLAPGLHVFVAIATGPNGEQYSAPTHITIHATGTAQQPTFVRPAPKAQPGPGVPQALLDIGVIPKADHADHRLIAYRMPPSAEKALDFTNEVVSAPFQSWPINNDEIVLSPEHHAEPGAVFSGLVTHDAGLQVRLLYGKKGLLFGCRITDGDLVPVPNSWERYQFDAVDLFLDHRSPTQMRAAAAANVFLSPQKYALTVSQRQFQINARRAEDNPCQVSLSRPHLWRMQALPLDGAMLKHLGIAVKGVRLDRVTYHLEVQIPWNLVGDGLSGPPPTGTRLALNIGYNDRDPGESVQSLFWTGGINPWRVSGVARSRPEPWGSLILGPELGQPISPSQTHQ